MNIINPFDKCPVYETENFIFTKVKEEDAEELFECYSDKITKNRMNNDNCGGVWKTPNVEAVLRGIRGWNREYEDRFYIRWSIHDKQNDKKVGTIEIAPIPNTTRFWDGLCKIGILRIDIISHLEQNSILSEILNMTTQNFFKDFDIDKIIIKATENDKERLLALENCKFSKFEEDTFPFSDYYVKRK